MNFYRSHRRGASSLTKSDRGKKTDIGSSSHRTEDIPYAVRSGSRTAPAKSPSPKIPMIGIAVGATMAVMGGFAYNAIVPSKSTQATTPTATTDTKLVSNGQTASNNNTNSSGAVLGHFPYTEAPASELTDIDGGFRLRTTAARKFRSMLAAARTAGVNITTISAFRSVTEQERLFFEVGARRAQQPSKRAEVSAPPKHSEHHTGYAVDLGDAGVASANLNTNFENTPAYKWLTANAARYGFELSFPKDNRQGVSYEPWHWRFVGNTHSLETFYKAHQLNPNRL
jgi:zinc D-Ala-D-Ala carboxypeptidase